ncbi:MAG TPA: hypothetical protein VJT74_06675, partial [Pyrinomonadaceae bacterium]|nr:hypothetical protein [Pyrinomonadaceae bacterium]
RALIERVFAARELGTNAAAPNTEGRQTISTKVSSFVASQGKLAAPAGLTVALASANSNRVTWQSVSGAFAYQILKREIGRENQRLNKPVVGRAYIDGDGSTDGYHHVAFVKGTSYVDNGYREEVFVPRGLKNAVAYEYVVRSLNVNANKQVGASANSKAATVPTAVQNVTSKVQAVRTASVSANGKTEFDQTLKNTGANIYTPVEFRIVSVSDPTVKVANADNGGAGTNASPASFYYPSALATNQVSAPRHLVFSNPNRKQFTFNAVVTARVQVPAATATRYQQPPTFDANFTTTTFKETFTGIVPVGDTGLQLADGVTYVDLPFTSKDGAQTVVGAVTTTTGVDLDLELRDSAGRVVASAATDSANETLTAAIQPNTSYVYRVVGWLGVAQDFQLVSTQTLRVPKTGATATTDAQSSVALTPSLRFTVNPLTGSVVAQLLQ